MSLRFDDDARHECLEAIRFYGRAAERFVQAVDVAIEQIRGDPERFREVERSKIKLGMDSIRAGRTIPAQQVKAEMAAKNRN